MFESNDGLPNKSELDQTPPETASDLRDESLLMTKVIQRPRTPQGSTDFGNGRKPDNFKDTNGERSSGSDECGTRSFQESPTEALLVTEVLGRGQPESTVNKLSDHKEEHVQISRKPYELFTQESQDENLVTDAKVRIRSLEQQVSNLSEDSKGNEDTPTSSLDDKSEMPPNFRSSDRFTGNNHMRTVHKTSDTDSQHDVNTNRNEGVFDERQPNSTLNEDDLSSFYDDLEVLQDRLKEKKANYENNAVSMTFKDDKKPSSWWAARWKLILIGAAVFFVVAIGVTVPCVLLLGKDLVVLLPEGDNAWIECPFKNGMTSIRAGS